MKQVLIWVVLLGGSMGLAQSEGRLTFEPTSGIVGTKVTATATGLPVNESVELVWTSVEASWNATDGQFNGINASDTRTVLATTKANAQGTATMTFTVPADYGYVHNVFVETQGEELARQGFTVAPHLSITPTSGPVGTPITVTLTGVGYQFWESVWHLAYDGAHTGWLSAITTKGTAKAVIPATGSAGAHTLQAISGTHPVPYLNQQQSPNYKSDVPTVIGELFEVTDGKPMVPPAPSAQNLPRAGSPRLAETSEPVIWSDFTSGPVGSPMTIRGTNFPANTVMELLWSSVRGNRISGAGWEEVESALHSITTDENGEFVATIKTPDDLGGSHRLRAVAENAQAELTYTITPSVSLVTPEVVEPGGDITVTIKGVGWTATANIYTLLLDNGYLGYGCGFNSQGDVTINLKAPGQEGMHYISIFPSIYQGEVTGPGAPSSSDANATYLQIPMLNHQDHPGEELPAFHLAFEVRG